MVLLLQVAIEEKLKNAPDNDYAIGVLIGNLLPFIVIVGIGYYLYYRAKRKNNHQ